MKYYEAEMTTIHPEGCVALTWEDAENAEKENYDCGWGFSAPDLLKFITDHMNAEYAVEDGEDPYKHYLTQERIEWRLEDANFHRLCEMLHTHNYKKATEWVASDIIKE